MNNRQKEARPTVDGSRPGQFRKRVMGLPSSSSSIAQGQPRVKHAQSLPQHLAELAEQAERRAQLAGALANDCAAAGDREGWERARRRQIAHQAILRAVARGSCQG